MPVRRLGSWLLLNRHQTDLEVYVKRTPSFFVILLLSAASALSGQGQAASKISKSYPVPVISQPSSQSCWAAAATMVYSWKNAAGVEVLIETVLTSAGEHWLNAFKSGNGLPPSEVANFGKALGFTVEAPQSFQTAQLIDLFLKRGPLWIGTVHPVATQYKHARVIVAMDGDGTGAGTIAEVNDPDGGRHYSTTLSQLIRELEEIARADYGKDEPLHPQILHY
jgi:Papain-like cysteine protease AvrRpt2